LSVLLNLLPWVSLKCYVFFYPASARRIGLNIETTQLLRTGSTGRQGDDDDSYYETIYWMVEYFDQLRAAKKRAAAARQLSEEIELYEQPPHSASLKLKCERVTVVADVHCSADADDVHDDADADGDVDAYDDLSDGYVTMVMMAMAIVMVMLMVMMMITVILSDCCV